MYAEAVRIPWLMRIPQLASKGRPLANPVSHIDMVPTVLELMGGKAKEPLPGQSLVPLIKGGQLHQDHVHIEWNPGSGALKQKKGGTKITDTEALEHVKHESTRTVVSPDGWKLCLSDLDKCQLFNLQKDPGETVNLFDSGLHRDGILRLTKKIHEWQQSVQDKAEV